MRGKVVMKDDTTKVERITPAYAGKSFHLVSFCFQLQDHPRLCGEKPVRNASEKKESGSPPPMRGKAIFRTSTRAAIRITPAYAGKSKTSGQGHGR